MAKPLICWQNLYLFLVKLLSFGITSISSWLNLYLLTKPLPFDTKIIIFDLNYRLFFGQNLLTKLLATLLT
jgi:hypothetical protein